MTTKTTRATTMKLAGAAAVTACGLICTAATTAFADAPSKYAWYYMATPQAAPLAGAAATPAIPGADQSNSLVVGGGQGTNTAISALEFSVPSGTPGATLTLKVANAGAGASSAGTPVIDACTIGTDTWTAGSGQPATAAPAYSCAGAPTGTVSSDGSTVTFTLGAPSGTTYDVALVPDASAQPFTTVFATPDQSALSPDAIATQGGDQSGGYSPAPSDGGAASSTSPSTAAPSSSGSGTSGSSGSSSAVSGGAAGSASSSSTGSVDAGGSSASSAAPAAGGISDTSSGSSPAVAPLPSSPAGAASSGAPAASSPAGTAAAVTPASSSRPASGGGHDWLVGAVGLGLMVLGLLYGATKQARAPKLLGSLSIGSLKADGDL